MRVDQRARTDLKRRERSEQTDESMPGGYSIPGPVTRLVTLINYISLSGVTCFTICIPYFISSFNFTPLCSAPKRYLPFLRTPFACPIKHEQPTYIHDHQKTRSKKNISRSIMWFLLSLLIFYEVLDSVAFICILYLTRVFICKNAPVFSHFNTSHLTTF